MLPPPSDLGRCPCGGMFDRRLFEVTLRPGDREVVCSDVPIGVCPDCGGRVYNANTLALLEAVLRGG
jgi:YgiT-type zinc finger domain-containing protein